MRRLVLAAVTTAFLLGLPGLAGAAPLNWSGTSTTYLGDFPTVNFFGGGVATINNSGGGIGGHLQTLRMAGSRGGIGTELFTLFVTDPDTVGNSIAALRFENVGSGTGTMKPISGAAASTTVLTQSTLPIPGVVRICLLSTDCSSSLDLILTENGTRGVGIGGLLTIGGDSPIRISVEGAPWTIKTATAQDQITTTGKANQTTIPFTLKGFAHDPNSGTTSTAQPSGVVQLVTANQTQTNLPFGSSIKLGGGTVLRIHFIPEPGLMLLVGTGVAGLVLVGRRRLRK